MAEINLEKFIRDIPDFPKPGILFKDITPLLKDAKALEETINVLAKKFEGADIDYVVGIESRGFIFGTALATKMGTGFIPVRKKMASNSLSFSCSAPYRSSFFLGCSSSGQSLIDIGSLH